MEKRKATDTLYLFEDYEGTFIDWGFETRADSRERAEEILAVLNGDTAYSLNPRRQPARIVEYVRIKKE